MRDHDARHVLEVVQHHQVPADWTVFPAQSSYFVQQGVGYLAATLVGICGIYLIGYHVQHLVFMQSRGDAFLMQCTFVLFVGATLYALVRAIYNLWSVQYARDQVLVVTPDGFVTNAIWQRFSAQRFTVAFADLRNLTITRPFLRQSKCVELRFTTPVVSLPENWIIPRQFTAQDAAAQAIVEAYTRHQEGTQLQSSSTSVR